MNDIETASNSTSSIPRHLQYQKVRDGRKRPIRGLWVRNGRYYAQMTVKDPNKGTKSVRRVPLEVEENGVKRPVATVPEAVASKGRLDVQRADNALPVLGQTPKFCDYVKEYLGKPVTLNKTPKTIQTETGHLKKWVEHLGETRLDRITKPMIADFRNKRLKENVSPRTVNLAVGSLRVVLREAIEDGWIQRLPTENVLPLKYFARKRQLCSLADIENLCAAGMEVSKNGEQFRDYIMFMAFTGARCTQALVTKWADIDWRNRQLKIPRVGRGEQGGIVDFNPRLESHLKEMQSHKAPELEYIFPSPQRGKKDIAAKTFRETLKLARAKAGLPKFGFHDCRHFFASFSVMAGIDYMTIARWLGHSDGGILVAKVYGHLTNEHGQRQAERLSFEPIILQKTA
jgi:integrase